MRFSGYQIGRKFQVEINDLIEPMHVPHYYSVRELEIFAWMVRSVLDSEKEYQSFGVFDVLNCSSGIGHWDIDNLHSGHADRRHPDNWRGKLLDRFRHAILYRRKSKLLRGWRERNGIDVDSIVTINTPTVHPWDQVKFKQNPGSSETARLVDDLLNTRGNLAWCLNECHRRAISIHSIGIQFTRESTASVLKYGYPRDSSEWSHTLAEQKAGEPLLATLDRAMDVLTDLMNSESEPQILWHGKVAKPALKRKAKAAK